MNEKDTFSGFFTENRRLIREYMETHAEILRLQAIRIVAKSFSTLAVTFIVTLLLLFVVFFLGVGLAWWLSVLTGSNAIGFGITGILFLVLLVLVVALRRLLFQDPLIRKFISESADDPLDEKAGDI